MSDINNPQTSTQTNNTQPNDQSSTDLTVEQPQNPVESTSPAPEAQNFETSSPAISPTVSQETAGQNTTTPEPPVAETTTQNTVATETQSNPNNIASPNANLEATPETVIESGASREITPNPSISPEVEAEPVNPTAGTPVEATPSQEVNLTNTDIENPTDQQLNVPPEIAQAKQNVENAAASQPQAQQGSLENAFGQTKNFSPLKIILIVLAVAIIAVGGYLAYKYLGNANATDQSQTFIQE